MTGDAPGFEDGLAAAGLDFEQQGPWLKVEGVGTLPQQGWKLHVSTPVEKPRLVLSLCVAALAKEKVAFKVAANEQVLRELWEPGPGSQRGKFITVYPASCDQLVKIAHELAVATRGMSGPVPTSDKFLGGLVSYRYGGFGSHFVRLDSGAVAPALASPDGTFVEDDRSRFVVPRWETDPFAGEHLPQEPGSLKLVADRFLRLQLLQQGELTKTWLAADVTSGAKVVLKCSSCAPGQPGHASLAREREALAAIGSPQLVWAGEIDGDSWLAVEWIEGKTLADLVSEHTRVGMLLPDGLQRAIVDSLMLDLERIHQAGFVFHDLKTGNVVWDGNRARLIDFGHCRPTGSRQGWTGGTRGYAAPESVDRGSSETTLDMYSFGACVYAVTTGAEPSYAPDFGNLLTRDPRILNPNIPTDFVSMIASCLAPEGSRPGTVAALRLAPRIEPAPASLPSLRDTMLELRTSILASVESIDGRPKWQSKHPAGRDLPVDDVNAGSAGTLLSLVACDRAEPSPEGAEVAVPVARTLAARTVPAHLQGPGLYAGDMGTAVALGLVGRQFSNADLVTASVEAVEQVAKMAVRSLDMFSGLAGSLRGFCVLQRAGVPVRAGIGDEWAGKLLRAAEELVPEMCGYAHGAAGIGDALLDGFLLTADARILQQAIRLGDWLVSCRIQVGDRFAYPVKKGGPPTAPFWCHGGAGIGVFLARLSLHDARFAGYAREAAETVSTGTRWSCPVQCHGLAGNIECLMDIAECLGDAEIESWAKDMGEIMVGSCTYRGEQLVAGCETPDTVSPDYWVGYAGVAACLARLLNPRVGRLLGGSCD